MSSRNWAMSSGFQRVGRHARGDWLNTCMASQPRSTARPWALTRPPAVETWAPISKRRSIPAPARAGTGQCPVPAHRELLERTGRAAVWADHVDLDLAVVVRRRCVTQPEARRLVLTR